MSTFDVEPVPQVEQWFDPVPGYLNTAAVGLPTKASIEILEMRMTEWAAGRSEPPSFDPDVSRCRHAYAQIADIQPERVGIVGQVSVVSAMVAASLETDAVVLCAEEDFTSITFPFLADPRLDVRTVPLADLLDAIDGSVDLVAVSAVQSSDGRVIDLDGLAERCADLPTRTFVDTTQAAGWLPLDSGRIDVTACHGYKWLCSPRGSGFMTVSDDALEWLRPINAGWYAGERPWESIYGPPLRLASDARRFDVSPNWFSYAAAAPTLELLAEIGPATIGAHSVGLANLFRRQIGLTPSNSTIVSITTDRAAALKAAGVSVSERAGRARFSFYLYNTVEDVERASEIVTAPPG